MVEGPNNKNAHLAPAGSNGDVFGDQHPRPGIADSQALITALRREAEQFVSRTGIQLQAHFPTIDVKLEPHAASAAYRIFQEILIDVTQHDKATEVIVSLRHIDRALQLEVHDNGKSQDDLGNPISKSFARVKDRVAILNNGGIRIEGEPGLGALVRLEVPVL